MAVVSPMCFKKPKLPPKSAEDIKTEQDLKLMREAQQKEIAANLRTEKDAQTEASYARILGMTGNRSLITGPKGGAGYMGANSGRSSGRPAPAAAGGGIAPVLPSAAAPAPATPTYTPPATMTTWSGFGGGSVSIGGGQANFFKESMMLF